MKNMNRHEIKKFVNKYFKAYGNDIRKVAYNIYQNKVEFLINDHYLYIIKRNQ